CWTKSAAAHRPPWLSGWFSCSWVFLPKGELETRAVRLVCDLSVQTVVESPLWVNRRTAQLEHNTSASLPLADIRADIADGSNVPTADACSAAKEPRSLDRFIVGSTERGRLGLVRQCRNRYDFDHAFGRCKCRSINGSGSFHRNRDMLCDQPGQHRFRDSIVWKLPQDFPVLTSSLDKVAIFK